MYLAGWPRRRDYGLIAEQDEPIGVAWYRTFTEVTHGHGFVAEDVPELSIAVITSRRTAKGLVVGSSSTSSTPVLSRATQL